MALSKVLVLFSEVSQITLQFTSDLISKLAFFCSVSSKIFKSRSLDLKTRCVKSRLEVICYCLLLYFLNVPSESILNTN